MIKVRTKFNTLEELENYIATVHKRQNQDLDQKISQLSEKKIVQQKEINTGKTSLERRLIQQQFKQDNMQQAQQLSQMREFQLQELKAYEYLRTKKNWNIQKEK